MHTNYEKFTARMIQRYEGGYGWDKNDNGGPTKYGITCYDLAEHRGQKMDSMTRWAPIVKAMTLAEAEDIYAKKYATKISFMPPSFTGPVSQELRGGPDVTMMDYGVNSGYSRAIRVARAITGVAGSNTVVDQKLVDAINAMDPKKFVNSMLDERLRFMKQIKSWPTFGKGWTARVADLRAYALALVDAKPVPLPAPTLPPPNPEAPKVQHGDPNIVKKTTGAVVPAAPTSGGVAALLGGSTMTIVLFVLLVIALGVGFVIWKKRRDKAANETVVLLPGEAVAHA